MPTNANTFNSRVTSEALEKKFRDVFPAQGGAELVQDLFASGVIQPVIDFSSVAEGSVLPEFLQTAWDFATTAASITNTTATITSTTGFWKVNVICFFDKVQSDLVTVQLTDGITTKPVWRAQPLNTGTERLDDTPVFQEFYVFVNTGQTLQASSGGSASFLSYSARQVADLNGNLVNPLGFVFT